MSERAHVQAKGAALLDLMGDLMREMDHLHLRLVRIDQLAESYLASADEATLDESSVRALHALRVMAGEYMRAHDAAWHDARAARGQLVGARQARRTAPQWP